MPPRLLRAIVAMALLPWHLVAPSLGETHRHPADATHPHAVVHRHFHAHALPAHEEQGRELGGDDDHRIVWLGDALLSQFEYRLGRVARGPVATPFTLARLDEPQATLLERVVAPAHGPPRQPNTLRGPPSLSS